MRFRDFAIVTSLLALTLPMFVAAWHGMSMSKHRLGIDHAALDAIEIGMTQVEVDARIGGPPGDYTGGRFGTMRFT